MDRAVRTIARTLRLDGCCIVELLADGSSDMRAHFSTNERCAPPKIVDLGNCPQATQALRAGRQIRHGDAILAIPGSPQPYGLLCAFRAHRSLTRPEISFLQSVADLLSQMISLRWRQQIQASVLELSRVLRPASTRKEIMALSLSHIHAVCPCAGAAIILQHDSDGPFVAWADGIWAAMRDARVVPQAGPTWQVLHTGQTFHGPPSDLPAQSALDSATLCMAMHVNQQPIGALWVACDAPATHYHQQLLLALADVAAVAINRSHQHEQTARLYQEHQQLSRELCRAERYLTGIIESAMDLVVATTTTGQIVTWNRSSERVSGFSRAQMVGRRLCDLFAPAHQILLDDLIARLDTGATFEQLEIPLRGASGQEVPVVWRISRIQSNSGESVGIVAIGRDLVDCRRLESQLFQAAKMASMGVMASGIGHELRNPLSVISANAQLAQERRADELIVQTCLHQIHMASHRAGKIIDNLLTFARPCDSGCEVVDLNEVLAAVFLLLDYQIQQRHVQLHATLAHPIPTLLGNPALLQQVFTNLILNALQAMESGGAIYVTTQVSEAQSVEVTIRDTGVGIPPDVLPQIFDPFFTSRPVGQGTGLGLAISYSIINQHGGSIQASSTPGKGSTFRIYLPATGATDRSEVSNGACESAYR